VTTSQPRSDWPRLFRIARALIRQVNSERELIDHWTFGGGTAMMLQVGHRESRDVDIFLSDPQLLPLLDPQKRDFQFEISPSECGGDGVRFLKLAFAHIGEIDFIVAGPTTPSPSTQALVEGDTVLLDTIPEIITKKIHYRGASIKPRDIFDIAAAGERHADAIVEALRSYPADVARTLTAMERLNPVFVRAAIADLLIKERYVAIAESSLDRAKKILRSV
jgi:hypothetical protein